MGIIRSKKSIEIDTGFCADGKICSVTVFNAITRENCFNRIGQIIETLICGKELFFGFYRTDGLTFTKQEWEKYSKEIPAFFKENGEYKELVEEVIDRNGIAKIYKGILTVAKADLNEELLTRLQRILQYYLESTFFVPNISFHEFETVYKNYMKQSTNEYLVQGYTDYVFCYFDSRHFSVSFDPKRHSAKLVSETVERAFK